MNINRYALCKERSLQKIISKQPKPNTTAIGVCSETQVTHHIITKRSDECLPISAYVPKHKEGDGKKFPVIIDIYGGDFVAGRSALNRNFGTWCAEHGYLTFIPEYTSVPETNLFGQLGDLLKAFVVIHRCAERYGADMSRMYLVGDGAGAALACLVYALLWNPVSMQHLEDELPFDVPQEAKLTFKAVCLQNGILDLSSRKMNAIAPYLIEKDWKKTSYAECLSPKTYAKMLPPCLLVTSITDAHKRDTNQLAWQLKLKGTRYSVHSANNLFTKESFAARHPETRYAQAANTAMLAFSKINNTKKGKITMANYHKRNSIRAVQWDPENTQSFEDIKKLVAENPGLGWKADNIVRNDASDNIIIRSFGMIVLRIKPYEYLVEGKKDSLFTVPPETFELMYESDESRKW